MGIEETLKTYLSKEEIDSLLTSINEGKLTHCVLLNSSKISDEDFLKNYPLVLPHPIVKHCFIYDNDVYPFGKSLLFEAGAIYIQEPSSALPAYFLNPKEGERILDLCAAPGGKSIGLSLLMPSSLILSNDLSYQRALTLSSNVERMGRGNIVVTSIDFEKHYQEYEEYFDAIMLDAPCSGSATFRKDSEAKDDWSIEKVKRCQGIQSRLLEIAFFMLKKGGRLLYSTCSFSFEEDEGVVLPFLANHNDARIVDLPDNPLYFHSKQLKEAVHLLPFIFPGEGQFAALIKKEGDLEPNQAYKKEKKISDILLKDYSLEDRDNRYIGKSLYSNLSSIKTSNLHILRYGIKVSEEGSYIPDFHLARSLGKDDSKLVNLTKQEAVSYLQGESFKVNVKDGVYPVAYKGLSLGFAKIVSGTLKNHYPKGLRKKIEIDY